MTSMRSSPFGVSRYSVRTGVSGITSRSTIRSASSSFSRSESILSLSSGIAARTSPKRIGWFGGPGYAQTRAMMGSHFGFRPAAFWMPLGCVTELGGGLLVLLGLATPLGALAVVAAMLVAVGTHWPKVWGTGGLEYPLVLAVVGVALGVLGPGRLSVDALPGLAL